MSDFNENYWSNRYRQGETPWDAGAITTPLQEYIDQLRDRRQKILIPGGGNGYEAAYLHAQGFEDVYLLDLSPLPLQNFRDNHPQFPATHLLQGDFFEQQGGYDLILEQTFFCALDPALRPAYARKAADLLKPGGRLVGVLFEGTFNKDQPPFGGDREEYRGYFEPHFKINKLEPCYNSIKPRAGRELWIDVVKE